MKYIPFFLAYINSSINHFTAQRAILAPDGIWYKLRISALIIHSMPGATHWQRNTKAGPPMYFSQLHKTGITSPVEN